MYLFMYFYVSILVRQYVNNLYIMQRIEDKGKDYGTYVKAGKFRWFVRETGRIYFSLTVLIVGLQL